MLSWEEQARIVDLMVRLQMRTRPEGRHGAFGAPDQIVERVGSSAPALVREWVLWLNGMEGIPGIAVLTAEARLRTAPAAAASGKRPSIVCRDVLQAVWAEEGSRR
jgi:hypothetical protein